MLELGIAISVVGALFVFVVGFALAMEMEFSPKKGRRPTARQDIFNTLFAVFVSELWMCFHFVTTIVPLMFSRSPEWKERQELYKYPVWLVKMGFVMIFLGASVIYLS